MVARRRDLLALGLLAATSCRRLPPELSLPPEQTTLEARARFDDLDDALRALLGHDPLARVPRPVDASALHAVEGDQPLSSVLASLRNLSSTGPDRARSLQALEATHARTLGLLLVRGDALALADAELVRLNGNPAVPELAWITPLLTALRPGSRSPELARHPLAHLAPRGGFADSVRRHADLRALSAWLASPDVPLRVAAELLEEPAWDALAGSRVGRLIRARAAGEVAPHESALALLDRATTLWLEQVAATRDREQAAAKAKLEAARRELGVDDPIGTLLASAYDGLLPAAGDPRAAGAAWLADRALAWAGPCELTPCAGLLSRTSDMARAGAWHPDVEARAAVWRAGALDEALDRMDVGRDTVAFPGALVDLVDALLGTGATPPSMDLLRRRLPDEATWRMLADTVGVRDVTTWEAAHAALGAHLRAAATNAAAHAPPQQREFLDLIARRAVP